MENLIKKEVGKYYTETVNNCSDLKHISIVLPNFNETTIQINHKLDMILDYFVDCSPFIEDTVVYRRLSTPIEIAWLNACIYENDMVDKPLLKCYSIWKM